MANFQNVMQTSTYRAVIEIGGDFNHAKQICQQYCMDVGLCVTIDPTTYVYTGACETGVRVGLINYARFPSTPEAIFNHALTLARLLQRGLAQHSFSIVADDKTLFETVRAG